MAKVGGIKVVGHCATCRTEVRAVTEPGRVQAKLPCPTDPGHPQVICRRAKTAAAGPPAAAPPAAAEPSADGAPAVIDVPRYRKGAKDEPGPGDPGHADPTGQRPGGDTGDGPGDVGSTAAGVRAPASSGRGRGRVGFGRIRPERDDPDDPDDIALSW